MCSCYEIDLGFGDWSWCFVGSSFKSKYNCDDHSLPSIRCMNNCSDVWREIFLVWNFVLLGCRWVDGNGKRIRFWKDRWLSFGLIIFNFLIQNPSYSEVNLFMSDYIKIEDFRIFLISSILSLFGCWQRLLVVLLLTRHWGGSH